MNHLLREAKQAPAANITHYHSCVGHATFDICPTTDNDPGGTFEGLDGPFSSYTIFKRAKGTQGGACEAIAIARRAKSGVPSTCGKDSRR
jgi:hypothetical protein